MNIVITGAAGYIGSKLTKRMVEWGHHVKCFDNLFFQQYPLVKHVFDYPKCQFYAEDVNSWSDNLKRAIDEAHVIFPLAALVGAPLCDKYPSLAKKVNQTWLEKLVTDLSNQIVIYPNTNSGYGSNPGLCTEETPLNPLSHYALTKKAGEDAVRSWRRSVCFRLATVFGDSPRPRTDLLINNLAGYTGNIEVFDGHFRRNYIHIDDVISAFEMAIVSIGEMAGQVYNLGNDSLNMTKLDLVQKICDITRATYSQEYEKTDPDKRDYEVSSQKLYNLGFRCKRDLETGVREMQHVYRTWSSEALSKCRNY